MSKKVTGYDSGLIIIHLSLTEHYSTEHQKMNTPSTLHFHLLDHKTTFQSREGTSPNIGSAAYCQMRPL